MSIDKESNGVPEVNVHRPTTKVNLWMIAAVMIFFAVMAAAAVWIARRSASPAAMPPSAAEGATGNRPG